MPILSENKHLYPKNWKEISDQIRERDGNKCKWCGVTNYSIIKRGSNETFRKATEIDLDMIYSRIKNCHSNMTESLKYHRFIRIVLTTAHLDHNPENCTDENLASLCQRCHLKYDAKHHKQTMKKNKYKGMNQLF